nr:transcriptional regulator [uncultured Marvinbryantia sp.]
MAGKSKDLTGQRFGHLTVLGKTKERFCGYVVWRCRCDCGRETLANTKYLQRGTTTDCGCIPKTSARGRNSAEDLTGQRFGMLKVESRAENRRGHVYWNCLCDCGNEVEVTRDALLSGTQKSCGCLRREVQDGIRDRLTRVDGTCIEWLEKRKYRSDNTSGFRGVNETSRGGYRVNIGFKGRRFYLGRYKTFDEAVKVRLEAEEMIHGGFVRSYRLWNEKAQADAEWAQQNPLVFEVVKEKDGLHVVSSVPENG